MPEEQHNGKSMIRLAREIQDHTHVLLDESLPTHQRSLVHQIRLAAQAITALVHPHTPTPPIPDSPPQHQPSLNILLVEDNPFTQKLMTRLFTLRNHRVKVASNGKEALDILEETDFNLILMDIRMPVMDGLKTTLAIRQWEQKTGRTRLPIIALTALVSNKDRQRTIQVGMDGFHGKPVRADQLFAEINRLVPGLSSPIQNQSIQDQSIQDQSIQDQSIQDQSMQDQSIQDQSIQDQSMQDQSMQDQSIQDQSIQDQSIQDQSIQDQSIQDQSIQDQSIQDQSIQEPFIEDVMVLDIKRLLNTVDGDWSLLEEVVDLYFTDAPKQIARMAESIEQKDPLNLREAAHSLKGASGAFGKNNVYELALNLEKAGQEKELSQAPSLLKQLKEALIFLENALSTEITKNRTHQS